MTKKKWITCGTALLVLLSIIATIIGLNLKKVNNKLATLDAETLKSMTYSEITDKDSKIDNCEYVQFSAFFTRDLNGDGNAEKLNGTCKNVNSTDFLYIDLNVQTDGYLKDGVITINSNNFKYNMKMIKDDVLKNNYISDDVKKIELNNVNAGTEKLIIGNILANIQNDTNNYSNTTSITLTGTHVSDENVETPINKTMNIETKCVQAGWQPKKGEPRELPIYQSTTFKYDTSEEMGKLFDLEAEGYFYTRLQNPTNDSVAAKICAMEGGVAAMLTSSGQAANFFAVFNICEAGDHLIASSSIYGGTYNLFGTTLKKMGIECTFVDQDLPEEELAKLFKPNTKVVFGETITNPTVSVFDIEKFARLAHSHGVPLIVDNTFATPVNCRPFEFGADIVTHSTTKYMDGHATAVGGCIVDSGNFDWLAHADKYPGLTTPDDSYHGIVYAERFGKAAYITKATSQLMRDLGAIQSPQHAYYLNIGLESLHLRMKKHCENALAVAKYLKNNENVAWVSYPDLEDDKYHELAKKYLPNGSCGVLAFGIKGGREESIKFMDSLKFITIVTHVADARSCILHPASHTHRQMTDEQLIEAGVAPDLIRLSVGIENADDIIADLAQAFEKI